MLLQVAMLKDLPVASLEDEAKIATVADVVIHPETGELVGFWVQPSGWFAPKRALSSRDIVDYDPGALIVRSADSIVDPEEVRPFSSVVAKRDSWLGKRVEDENGQNLGQVTDLVLDTDLEILRKIEVSSLLGPRRLLSREDILRVTPKIIVVRTDDRATHNRSVVAEEVAS